MAMFVNVNPNFKSELMRTVQSPRDEILEYLDIAYGLADSAVDVLQGSTSELSSDFLLKLESTKITINETASKLNLIVNYLKKNPSLHLPKSAPKKNAGCSLEEKAPPKTGPKCGLNLVKADECSPVDVLETSRSLIESDTRPIMDESVLPKESTAVDGLVKQKDDLESVQRVQHTSVEEQETPQSTVQNHAGSEPIPDLEICADNQSEPEPKIVESIRHSSLNDQQVVDKSVETENRPRVARGFLKVPVHTVVPAEQYNVRLLMTSTPDYFWLRMKDDHLKELEEEMQAFYMTKCSLVATPVVGTFVVCRTRDTFFRAKVAETFPLIRVVFIDYGTIGMASKGELYAIDEAFCRQPARGIACRMANMRPCGLSESYSTTASDYFRKMLLNTRKDLTAIFHAPLMVDGGPFQPDVADFSVSLHLHEASTNANSERIKVKDVRVIMQQKGLAESTVREESAAPSRQSDHSTCSSTKKAVNKMPTFLNPNASVFNPTALQSPQIGSAVRAYAGQPIFGYPRPLIPFPFGSLSLNSARAPFPSAATILANRRINQVQPVQLATAYNPSVAPPVPPTAAPVIPDSAVQRRATCNTSIAPPALSHLPSGAPPVLSSTGSVGRPVVALPVPPTVRAAAPVTHDSGLQHKAVCIPSVAPPVPSTLQSAAPLASGVPTRRSRSVVPPRNLPLVAARAGDVDAPAADDSTSSTASPNDFQCGDRFTGDKILMHRFLNGLIDGDSESQSFATCTSRAGSPSSQCLRVADLKQRWVNVGQDKVVKFLLMHVSSPSNFYVHLLDELTPQFDDWIARLQAMYVGTKPVPNLEPDVGTIWVALEGANWKRVEVIGFDPDDGQVKVHYLDYGYTAIIDTTRLRHMERQFCKMPTMALPCTLAGVHPPQEMMRWSDRSTDMFVELASYDENLAWVYDFQSGPVVQPLQLIVMKERDKEKLTVNELLVQCGMAGSDYFCQEQAERDCYDGFDPMADDYYSHKNTIHYNPENYDSVTTGYIPKDEERICRFFNNSGRCYKGDKCQQKHVRKTPAFTMDEEEVFVHVPEFPVPKPGTILGAQVSCVINPFRFYVIFPYDPEKGDGNMEGFLPGAENIETLQDDLQREYKQNYMSHQFCTIPELYSIVIFKNQADGTWYRGRLVSDLDDGYNFVVFAVDFGFEQKVRVQWICRPMHRFMHLPAQAVECFLNGVRASSANDNKHSRELFARLTKEKFLFAKIVSHEPHVSIDLFDTSDGKTVNVAQELVKSLTVTSE